MECLLYLLLAATLTSSITQVETQTLPEAVEQIIVQDGGQYNLFMKLTNSIQLPPNTYEDVFKALRQMTRDEEEIRYADVAHLYWHDKVTIYRMKALNFLKSPESQETLPYKIKIFKDDIQRVLKRKEFKIALIECTYYQSDSLKQSCLADKFSSYIYHTLEDNWIKQLMETFGPVVDNKIAGSQIKKDTRGSIYEYMGTFSHGGDLLFENFKAWVNQEAVSDVWRACREWEGVKDKDNNIIPTVKMDITCLRFKLNENIYNHLSDVQIALLFRVLDGNDDERIDQSEMGTFTGVDGVKQLKNIMSLLDKDSDQTAESKIDFGEFRTYMRSPTVLFQAELECTTRYSNAPPDIIIPCLLYLLKNLLRDTHQPILLVMPKIELTIAYEILDVTGQGLIRKSHMIGEYKRLFGKDMNINMVNKFFEEVDTNIDDQDAVDLTEFLKYMSLPHMVYGLADCLTTNKYKLHRGLDYPHRIFTLFDNFKYVDKSALGDWFSDYYSGGKMVITESDDLKKRFGNDEKLLNIFFEEFGQGGKQVSFFEFRWFSLQQELAERREKNSIVVSHTGRVFSSHQKRHLHSDMTDWLINAMSEYDIMKFFRRLDKNGDKDIGANDFENASDALKELIKHIDRVHYALEYDDKVSYREFWLWIRSPNAGPFVGNLYHVKDVFNFKCPKNNFPENQDLITCYVNVFMQPLNVLIDEKKIEMKKKQEEERKKKEGETK